MNDTKKAVWVLLDCEDLTNLRHEHTRASAEGALATPMTTWKDRIVAKVWLGVSGDNGITNNEPKLGPLGVVFVIAFIAFATLGFIDVAFAIVGALT